MGMASVAAKIKLMKGIMLECYGSLSFGEAVHTTWKNTMKWCVCVCNQLMLASQKPGTTDLVKIAKNSLRINVYVCVYMHLHYIWAFEIGNLKFKRFK